MSDGPSPGSRRQLAGGALASLAGQLSLLLANGLLSVIVARAEGTGGAGEYGVAVTLFSITVPTASLGLRAGISYLVGRGEWPEQRALWESQAVALALAAVAAAIVFAISAAWPDGPLEGLGTAALAITMASAALAIAWSYSSGIAIAVERYELFGLSMIVQAVVTLALGAALTLAFGVLGALGALAGAQLSAAVITARGVHARRHAVRGERPPRGRPAQLRRAASFGSRTWLGEMFWGLNFRLDILVLNAYAGASTVGSYFVAGQLTTLAWLLPGALQNVVIPRIAALDASAEGPSSGSGSAPTVARTVRHGVLLALPAGLGIAAVLLVGVPLLFGSDFSDAVVYGFILLPGVLAAGVGKVAAAAVIGRGRPGYALLPMLLVTPVTVVFYLLVIPSAGAYGAAGVSTVSYAASAAVTVLLLRRATGLKLMALLVPRLGDLSDYRSMAVSLGRYVADRVSGR